MEQSLNHIVFKKVSEVCQTNELKAFVIGGFVRDLLLHRPSKDIDIVTEGSGIEFAQKVARLLDPKIKVNVFKNFGTPTH